MKLFFAWVILFILILFSFYYINLNLEKTFGITEFINISKTKESITYSAKNINNNEEIVEFSLNKNSEILVINGNITKENKNSHREIILEINRPKKDVILVLNSKDKTTWNIIPSEETNIKLVLYGFNNTILSKRKILKYQKEIDLDLNLENIKFIKFLTYINKITQKDRIDYFYSKDELENKIQINKIQINPKLSLKYLSVIKPNVNFEFNLISKDYKFIPFSLQGPKNIEDELTEIKKNVVSSPNRSRIYEITKNGLKIINVNNKSEIFKPIPILRKIPNVRGIAYDDLSDMVYIANKNGKFYIFDAVNESWKSIRKYINDFSINSISYDTFTNTFLSTNWKKNGLILFDQKGNFDRRYSLENKLLGFKYHYKKTDEIPQLYLVPYGENIAIILIDKIVEKIWLFNKFSRNAILTYNYMN